MAADFLTESSMKQFSHTISRTISVTKRSARSVVKQATIKFLQSARKIVKIGKRLRYIEQAPQWKPRSGKMRYRIQVLRQNKKKTWIYTNKKSDKRKIIKNRGLAKASFGWMLSGLGKSSASGKFGGNVRNTVSVKDRTSSAVPEVEFVNHLTYLMKRYPRLDVRAMKSAESSMRYMLDNEVTSKMQKEFRR